MQTLQDLLAPTIIDIWASMLALDAVEQPVGTVPDVSPTFVGCVHLTGATSTMRNLLKKANLKLHRHCTLKSTHRTTRINWMLRE